MRIFLTGASGLIGGEVASRLVARGHDVTAAIHRNPAVLANDGTPVAIAERLPIDLARPDLGIGEADAARIAKGHDLIVHCAATTRFDLPLADYRAVNVGGSEAILALAARGDLPVLYVSTAYVCGPRDGPIGEDEPLPVEGFANGYEASKAQAERRFAAAGPRHVIARPSIVLGEHRSGRIRSFEALYTAFRLFAHGKLRHMPAAPGASLDFVPIDHVAAGLVALAERHEAAAGGRYHLVSARPIRVADWAAAIGRYPQFREPRLVAPAAFDPALLAPAERRIFARVGALYASYFSRDPHFDDRRFAALTGIAAPRTGHAYVERLIEHCIEAGFLRAGAP